jgi:hypothetical protein
MMKLISILAMSVFLFGCSSLPHHMGEVPNDLEVEVHGNIDEANGEYSELYCSEGERQYFFLGTSKPNLTVSLDNSIFASSYDAVRFRSGHRNINLRFEFSNLFANFKVRNFNFEPGVKYYAKYSVGSYERIKVWIEKSDGTVVYGKKPDEGHL